LLRQAFGGQVGGQAVGYASTFRLRESVCLCGLGVLCVKTLLRFHSDEQAVCGGALRAASSRGKCFGGTDARGQALALPSEGAEITFHLQAMPDCVRLTKEGA